MEITYSTSANGVPSRRYILTRQDMDNMSRGDEYELMRATGWRYMPVEQRTIRQAGALIAGLHEFVHFDPPKGWLFQGICQQGDRMYARFLERRYLTRYGGKPGRKQYQQWEILSLAPDAAD